MKTNRADEAEMHWPDLDRSDVKRRALQTGVFFLIGATINIAVAWGCAFWAAPATHLWDSEVHKPNLAAAWVDPPEGFPEQAFESGSVSPPQAGYQWFGLWGDDGVDIGEPFEDWWPDVFTLDLIEAGWPFASFVGGLWQRQPRRPERSFDIHLWEDRAILVDAGSSVDDWLFDDWTIIPLMPKWLGFLANTIFFGGVGFLLFRLSSTLRQQVTKGACREGSISTVGGLP